MRPERGTIWASSRRGKVTFEPSSSLMATERAPRASGLKRPPCRTAWSWVLKWASMETYAAVREEKSRGSSGLGWPWSALEEELGEDDDESDGAAESASREEGLLLAPAILRFLRRGAQLLNERTDEGA